MSKLRAGAEALTGGAKVSTEDSDSQASLAFRISADVETHSTTGFALVIQSLMKMRADEQLLFPHEWRDYEQACSSKKSPPPPPPQF